MMGHILPVAAETGASYGDLDEQFMTARFCVTLTEAALTVDSECAIAKPAPSTTGSDCDGERWSQWDQIADATVSAAPPIASGINQNRPMAACDAWLYAEYARTPMRWRAGSCSID